MAVFFGLSFEFNQPIEIYIFGATAWPRAIIGLLLVATLGTFGFNISMGRLPSALVQMKKKLDFSAPGTMPRMVAVLLTPFLFAWLLKPIGIYSSAPFFIAAIIWLFGEKALESDPSHDWNNICRIYRVVPYDLNAPLPQGNSSFYDFSAWILTMNAKLQGI